MGYLIKDWVQFFEADDGRKSMTRLLCFLSFFPSTFVLLITAIRDSMHLVEIFSWYLGSFVLGYVGGKITEQVGDAMKRPKAATAVVQNVENVNVARPG
jgi:hypothetical protein